MLKNRLLFQGGDALVRLLQPFRTILPGPENGQEGAGGQHAKTFFSYSDAGLGSALIERDIFTGDSLTAEVCAAVEKTGDYYLRQQHPDGYWWYELESNATMTAEYLMLLYFLGLQDPERDRKFARHILRHQRDDGTWALHWGGDGDISTTVESYFALKLAGLSADDRRMRRAKDFVLASGGVENTRVFTKIFLALFGEFDWRGVPSIPVELNLLPAWFPVNIYNFSSWARSTIVPLSLILDSKPVRPVPEAARIRELFRDPESVPPITSRRLSPFSWKRAFVLLDRFIKLVEDKPVRVWRGKALEFTERWVLEHQEADGDWGGIQPAMVNSVLGLVSLGYGLDREVIVKGLSALERFTIEDPEETRLQACISPVWDTALTALGLLCSGTPKDHPAVESACRWLVSKQIFRKGDWSIKRPSLEPGGWAFEFENNWYPDIDDTAMVLLLLARCVDGDSVPKESIDRGLQWVLGMQGRDGGWGAFDVDNDMKVLNQLPFGDLEAMIDPSSPDVTGRVLELLGLLGYPLSDRVVRRAMQFIRRTQEEDGTWWGRWGVNYIYGTSMVLSGLASIGEEMSSPYVRKAVLWLKEHINTDGGWGECCESYGEASLKCHGESSPSQTAWAVMGLIAAGEESSSEAVRGVRYLLEEQKEDGTWDEQCFTGTGFPKYFMIRYHNYRNCFPLIALGKYLSAAKKRGV